MTHTSFSTVSVRIIQSGGTRKAARVNPHSPANWQEHFAHMSSEPEIMTDNIRAFINDLPVSDTVRTVSRELDSDLTDEEIDEAVKRLRPGAGGGDGIPPVVIKALFADADLAQEIRRFVRLLWQTPAEQWQEQGLDGPGLQVPLWNS